MGKLFRQDDQAYMRECLKLALRGAGFVSPNPLVGAIVVKNGKIIGRGYHKKFGGAHAEVHAIRSARTSVRGATLYVNLEPCNRYGKTPPCTKLLIESKIKKVIVGMKDPNPLISGKGIAELRSAGIQCIVGVLRNDCEQLNEAFTKFIKTKTPFVALKVAQTLDGKIANKNGKSKWITTPQSRAIVHQLRSRYDAVLVGAGTVKTDNPRLTVRAVRGRDPIRIVLDGRLSCEVQSKIFSTNKQRKTILFTSTNAARKHKRKVQAFLHKGVEVILLQGTSRGELTLTEVLNITGLLGIASVLVEGGSHIFSSFMSERLVDKVYIFIAPKIFGKGIHAFQNEGLFSNNKVSLTNAQYRVVSDDLFIEASIK
jgi:diaminohydroxyphosphoribosylaminopyrimidine deaminase/5-amino-6-(5-phosphoribosylamino)uracil reductase